MKNNKKKLELTESEYEDFLYICTKRSSVQPCLNPQNVKFEFFNENQVYQYFDSCFHQLAEATFLEYVFLKNLKKRCGLSDDTKITVIGKEIHVDGNNKCRDCQCKD